MCKSLLLLLLSFAAPAGVKHEENLIFNLGYYQNNNFKSIFLPMSVVPNNEENKQIKIENKTGKQKSNEKKHLLELF